MSVLVGVSGPEIGGQGAWWATRLAIARTGASAVRLTHSREVVDVDALIIGGGSHVDPQLYEQERQPDYRNYDAQRDRFELALIRKAEQHQTPILAICRGMQLLNVSRGGTLCQDAWRDVTGDTRNSWRARFRVDIKEHSHLRKLLQRNTLHVNRLHRQSIDQLGSGLRIAARGQGGIVQAIEGIPGSPLILGVQWHPEYLPHRRLHQQLFFSLTAEARKRKCYC